MDLTAIVTWIIFGAIVGVIARFLMPGRDSMGWIPTIVLGIVGSFVGGWLAQLLFQGSAALPPPSAGWIGRACEPVSGTYASSSRIARRRRDSSPSRRARYAQASGLPR